MPLQNGGFETHGVVCVYEMRLWLARKCSKLPRFPLTVDVGQGLLVMVLNEDELACVYSTHAFIVASAVV